MPTLTILSLLTFGFADTSLITDRIAQRLLSCCHESDVVWNGVSAPEIHRNRQQNFASDEPVLSRPPSLNHGELKFS